LEDFQDKNSHLFPSTDLTFNTPAELDVNPYQLSIGSKRKFGATYDSFSSWTDDLLFLPSELSDGDIDNLTFDETLASSVLPPNAQIDLELSSQSELTSSTSSVDHVDKKRKLDSDDELALYQSDARSSSPPGFNLLEDADVPPLSLSASSSPVKSDSVQVSNHTTTPLSELQKTIQGLDVETAHSLKESFLRLASFTKKEGNNSPFAAMYQTPSSAVSKVTIPQDILSLKMLCAPSTQAPVKSEPRQTPFYPVAPAPGMYSYLVNSPYLYPATTVPMASTVMTDSLNTKCSLSAPDHGIMYGGTLMNGNNFYRKNMYYSHQSPKKFNQNFVSPSVIPQSLYSHQAVHVL